jgi:hypothetical protein
MQTEITQTLEGEIILKLKLNPTGSMLEQEAQIAAGLNELGRIATGISLKSFDTTGLPIVIENVKHTSKGLEKKNIRRPTGKRK